MSLYKYLSHVKFKLKQKLRRLLRGGRPTRTFDEFFEHIKGLGFYPETVIDVGAADGTPSLQNAFSKAYFFWFEPLEEFRSALQMLLKKYSGEIHHCALMTEESDGSIYKTKDLFGSSVMHKITGDKDHHLQDIKIRTLDKVLAETNFSTPCLLKVDCQGGDYQVIQGGVNVLARCDLVILEVSFFRYWGDHHPAPLDIFNFMDNNGFVIYDILDGLFRPLDGALGQVDFVFVKKDGLFKKDHRWIAQ